MQPVRLSIFARSDMGRVRQNNEDSFVVSDLDAGSALDMPAQTEVRERGVLMVVSDGMGGHAAGEVASKLVVDSVHTALADHAGDRSSLPDVIDAAVKRANTDVWQAAREARKEGMGATLTAVLVHGADAYVAEVGDSRAYLLRAGNIRQITKDQSFVQLLLDAGALTPEEAKKSPQKNVILQGMGLQPDVHVAIGRLSLRRGDRFVLCSDGLSNKVHEDELRKILEEGDVATACHRMIDLANRRGGEDNITVVVAQASGEGLQEPSPEEPVAHALEVLQEFGAEAGRTSDGAADLSSESSDQLAPVAARAPAAAPAPAKAGQNAVTTKLVLGLCAMLAVAAVLWWFAR